MGCTATWLILGHILVTVPREVGSWGLVKIDHDLLVVLNPNCQDLVNFFHLSKRLLFGEPHERYIMAEPHEGLSHSRAA